MSTTTTPATTTTSATTDATLPTSATTDATLPTTTPATDATTTTTSTAEPVAVAASGAPAASTTDNEVLLSEAFARTLPAMDALTDEELTNINVELEATVTTVLGVCPTIRAMRPRIARELPFLDLGPIDSLEEYALATGHAHLEFLSASSTDETLKMLNGRAVELRQVFLLDVQALVGRGLLRPQQVAEYKGFMGYRNVAFELLGLTGVLRQSWPVIGTRTAIQTTELDEAERLGRQMLKAVGTRAQGPSLVAESTQRRIRAWTLLSRAYDSARRAVSYLRWEQQDVDSLVPSLYAGRGGQKKVKTPSAPPPAPTPVVTPTKPATVPAVPYGQPGGSPFIS